jgi:hypothetical protein
MHRKVGGLVALQNGCALALGPARMEHQLEAEMEMGAEQLLVFANWNTEFPAYKKLSDRDRRLATEDGCQVPPRGDLTPRLFSACAISRSVVAPSDRTYARGSKWITKRQLPF